MLSSKYVNEIHTNIMKLQRIFKYKHLYSIGVFCLLVVSIVIGSNINPVKADDGLYTATGQMTVNSTSVPNASITFEGPTSATATTDNNGNYSQGNLVNGSYNASLTFGSTAVSPVVTGIVSNNPVLTINGSNATQNFSFTSNILTITVKDPSNNPVTGAFVQASSQGGTATDGNGNTYSVGSNAVENTGTTDGNGNAQLYVLPGVTYSVCAYPSGGGSYCNTIAVSSDTTDTIYLATIPSAPTNLTIPSPTNAPVLTWTGASGANSYNIYANGVKIGNTTSTTYTDNSSTVGNDTYYVTAVNLAGESSPSNSVNVTVNNSSPPTITSAVIDHIDARVPMTFTVTTTGNPTPSITATGTLPPGITFTDNGNGTATFSGQASTTNNGIYAITLTATSSAGTATQTFYLTVDDAVMAPTIISANSATETYGTPFSFTVDTTGDPIPTIKKVSGSGSLPSDVTLHDNGDGTATLSGNLSANSDNGVYTFTIQAKNNQGTVTQPFTLTVNRAPTIANIATQTATVGTAYSQSITTSNGYPYPSLSASGLPNGLTLTDNGNGTATITGTPSTGDGGTYNVTITATNSLGTTTETYTLKVNEAPTITSANNTTATIGTALSFQVTSTGYPAPNYSLTGALPSGVTFHPGTGILSGTPRAGTAGTYPVTITATNSTGTVTQSFTLVVS